MQAGTMRNTKTTLFFVPCPKVFTHGSGHVETNAGTLQSLEKLHKALQTLAKYTIKGYQICKHVSEFDGYVRT